MMDELFREFLNGFVKIHILYHAGKEAVYGSGMMAELARHGYRLSPGTVYPTLHALERSGYLTREERAVNGRVRKYYRLTPAGRAVLDEVRPFIGELVGEVLGHDGVRSAGKEREP